MGVYATTTSIPELLPNYLVGNTTASDTAGVNVFSRHIDRAEGMVNSAIVKWYDPSGWITATTTTNVPPLVRTLSEDVACYFAIRGLSTADGQVENENLPRFEGAYEFVQDILKGKADILLAYTNGSLVPKRSSGMILSSSESYTPIFGLDDAKDWDRDADEVSDQSDARE